MLALQSHHDDMCHACPLASEADESVSLHKSRNLAVISMAKKEDDDAEADDDAEEVSGI